MPGCRGWRASTARGPSWTTVPRPVPRAHGDSGGPTAAQGGRATPGSNGGRPAPGGVRHRPAHGAIGAWTTWGWVRARSPRSGGASSGAIGALTTHTWVAARSWVGPRPRGLGRATIPCGLTLGVVEMGPGDCPGGRDDPIGRPGRVAWSHQPRSVPRTASAVDNFSTIVLTCENTSRLFRVESKAGENSLRISPLAAPLQRPFEGVVERGSHCSSTSAASRQRESSITS